jgi:hypothetical protein
MIEARYVTPDLSCVAVTLGEGDRLGNLTGPLTVALPWPAPGNVEADALATLFEGGEVEISAFAGSPEPVPAIISDRQFAQALALAGTITEAEALAWAARGELPDAMEDALEQIPDAGGQRFAARMMLAAATTYERHLPLTEQLGALLTNPATGEPYDAAALDALWTRAAAL